MAARNKHDPTPYAGQGYQRLFLRITLGTLVVGAVVGAALLMVGLYSGGGRVLGTCILSAAAAGLMMQVGRWLDDASRRRAGILGTCVVMASFLMAMLWIWWDAVFPATWLWEWRFALSALVTITIGGVSSVLLALATMPEMKWPARVGIPLAAICYALALVSIWQSSIAYLGELLAVLMWTSSATTLATVNFPLDNRHWRWLGVASSVVLFADAFARFFGNGTLLFGVAPFLWATAGTAAIVNVLLTLRAPAWAGFLRWTAIVCTTIAAYAAAIYEPILSQGGFGDDWVMNMIGALSLLAGCSAIGLALAMRLDATRKWEASAEPYKSLTVSCPRCAKRQAITLPESACTNCSLRFRITMHDDRCPTCGYDTSGLKSPTCPECGGGVLLRSAWEKSTLSPPSAAPHGQAG